MGNGVFLFFVVILLMSGLSRGTRRQLWALAVLAMSTFVSGNVYTAFLPFTRLFIESESGSRFAAFALVYIIVSVVLSAAIDALMIHDRRRDDDLEPADRLAGAVLGVVEAAGVAEVLAALVLTYPVLHWDEWVLGSDLVSKIFRQWPVMLSLLPSEFQHVLELLR